MVISRRVAVVSRHLLPETCNDDGAERGAFPADAHQQFSSFSPSSAPGDGLTLLDDQQINDFITDGFLVLDLEGDLGPVYHQRANERIMKLWEDCGGSQFKVCVWPNRKQS